MKKYLIIEICETEKENRENITGKKSLIGKIYIPNDNSYVVNLSDNKEEYEAQLGGDQCGNVPKCCLIISEPYIKQQMVGILRPHLESYKFINVVYNNKVYRVLFDERGVKN